MNYGKKYVIRWTPCLARVIVLFLTAVFLIGGLLGFIIGRVSAAGSDIPNEPSIQNTQNEVSRPLNTISIVVTPATSKVETSTPTEPEKFYYDCPLDHDLQDYIRDLCIENDVPMDLVIAMISVESSFRPNVVSGTNDYGLMQINKINHEWLSEEYSITDFLDPYQNVFCGITIIAEHLKKTDGGIELALMRYNCGATGAKRLWDKGIYHTDYTRKIMEYYEFYKQESRPTNCTP